MFAWVILHTAAAGVLAVVVLAASRCFRLGPAARHLLWLIVLIKFLTPPVVSWPWALPMYGPASAVTAKAWRAGSVSDRSSAPLLNEPPVPYAPGSPNIIETPPDVGPEPETIEAPAVEDRPAAPPFSCDWWPMTASWVWLAGGVLAAIQQATRVYGWRRRLTKGRPASDELKTIVRELADAMCIRPPRMVVLPCVGSPMVWCFGASRLIWSAGLEDRLSAEGLRAVLLHELAHLRRRDHWVGWLLLAGGCVWWWHPLFWWVRRRLSQEAELACDAYVIGAAPGARRAYAEALLEVSRRMSAAVAAPALGAAGGRRDLERRLVMIMRGPTSRRLSWAGLAGVVALGLLALPAWTLGEDKTPTPLPTVSTPPPVAVTEAPPVPSQPAAPGSTASKDPALLERDRKLKDMEEKVKQLMKEMQQLRAQSPLGGMNAPLPTAPADPLFGFLARPSLAPPTPVATTVQFSPSPPSPPTATVPAEPGAEVITLTRVTYKLKAAKAETLASFLKENVKTAILEIKNEGDSLTVTTTPDAQEVIGRLIDLMQGRKPAVTPTYGPLGNPVPGSTGMPSGMAGPGGTVPPPWPKFIGPPIAK